VEKRGIVVGEENDKMRASINRRPKLEALPTLPVSAPAVVRLVDFLFVLYMQSSWTAVSEFQEFITETVAASPLSFSWLLY
jgi:hypothetical protein